MSWKDCEKDVKTKPFMMHRPDMCQTCVRGDVCFPEINGEKTQKVFMNNKTLSFIFGLSFYEVIPGPQSMKLFCSAPLFLNTRTT